MMKSLLTVFSLTAVCAVQAGIVVDAQSDVPRRVCTDQLTFSWDWSWDWVGWQGVFSFANQFSRRYRTRASLVAQMVK